MTASASRDPAPGVPWYVHPAVAPRSWARLPDVVPETGFVVLNVHDGPGAPDDPYYAPAVAALGPVRQVGYVDVDYGRRPVADVASEAAQWLERYGSHGVMLDRLPSGAREARAVARYADAARRQGAATVVGNPGVVAAPEVLEHLDIACVAEETADRYLDLDLRVPPLPRAVGIWHLVHACPPELVPRVRERAAAAGADYLHVTGLTLPNPWQDLASITG
ncbi:spherulation-specific family 4 protein [Cellulosimicrobium cellulans]|uniref:spherulation-specific family 4 protein n=1 Tax=Cellulosimicrobium cellulans TaxID=1710 RepID=UPI002406F5DA|nr:spherulation-specific family 4 protein [Cellulosimicrobium cellulans]MDF9874972.1 hypothetical protein [Cellulosimicrobium cellulans]